MMKEYIRFLNNVVKSGLPLFLFSGYEKKGLTNMGLLKAGITDLTIKEYDRDKVCNEILSIAKREKLSLSQLVSVFDHVLYIIEQGNPVVV
jgi:hypothetical protein